MGETKQPAANDVKCPRCGYDQSGLIATWKAQCPLDGRCSECGLDFRWTEVINAHMSVLPGFIEHEPRGRLGSRVFVAAVRTFVWTVLPWRFWSRVKLHHPIRKRRWVVWTLVMLGLLHTTGVVLRTGAVVIHSPRVTNRTIVMPQVVNGKVTMATTPPRPMTVVEIGGIVIEQTGPPVVGLYDVWAVNWTPNSAVMLNPSRWSYYRPRAGVSGMAVPLISAMAFFPLMILVLPHTRRRAKVRSVHVARAAVYSMTAVCLLEIVMIGDAALACVLPTPAAFASFYDNAWYDYSVLFSQTLEWASMVTGGLIALWLPMWWLWVLSRGFRIERASMVWGIVLIPVGLAALVAELWVQYGIW